MHPSYANLHADGIVAHIYPWRDEPVNTTLAFFPQPEFPPQHPVDK